MYIYLSRQSGFYSQLLRESTDTKYTLKKQQTNATSNQDVGKKKQQPILYTHNETLEASLQYLTSSVLSPCGWQVTTPPEEGWNNTVVMAEGWWKAGSGRVQLLGSLLRFYRCIVVICAYARACVGVCVLCTFVWTRISDSVNACIHTCITYDFHHEYSHFLNAFTHSQQPPNRTTNFLFQQTPCKRIIPIRQL